MSTITSDVDANVIELSLDPLALAALAEINEDDGLRSRVIPSRPRIRGVFDQHVSKAFTHYSVELSFQDKIMGGTPSDPDIILGWLKTKMPGNVGEQELKMMAQRIMADRLTESDRNAMQITAADVNAVAEQIAAIKNTNGFKRDQNGLYIEGRQIKAMLRESTNIIYAGDRWGKTKKSPKGYLAERVFVVEDHVSLGREVADGIDLVIGHVTGPAGPRSTLSRHEYVERAVIRFAVMSFEDSITAEQWMNVLVHSQESGLGAMRSQGHGRFAVTAFDKVNYDQIS